MGYGRITKEGGLGLRGREGGDDISKVEVEKRRAPGLLGGL